MGADLARRNRRLSLALGGVALGMVGLAFASAPLYDLFCRMTGFGGTTQTAAQAPGATSERRVTVRFNADVHPHLPWRFAPTEQATSVRLGEPGLTAYRVESRSAAATVGTATFNVTPDKMGKYFSKTACFCFEEQTLRPGQTAELPVAFFVDPAMADDPATADVQTVTLSYTFFRARDEATVLARLK
jgi:cytochrome c oxidase assembly protein subunit 11